MKRIQLLIVSILVLGVMASCDKFHSYFVFEFVNDSNDSVYTAVFAHHDGDLSSSIYNLNSEGKELVINPSDTIYYSYYIDGTDASFGRLLKDRKIDVVYLAVSESPINHDYKVIDSLQSDTSILKVFTYSSDNADLSKELQTVIYKGN